MSNDDFLPVFLSGVVLGHIAATIISKKCQRQNSARTPSKDLIEYHGACHCCNVSFTVKAPRHLVVWRCNCTICDMKKNWHFIVPKENMKLHCDESALQEYAFGTHTAKHLFCKKCGVQAFYSPRSNPDGWAVTLACVSSSEEYSYEIREFEGSEWESFFGKSGISEFSKK